jgi:hypothetical protein
MWQVLSECAPLWGEIRLSTGTIVRARLIKTIQVTDPLSITAQIRPVHPHGLRETSLNAALVLASQ